MTFLPKALRFERDAMVSAILSIKPLWNPRFVTLHNTGVPSLAQWNAYSQAQKESWGDNLNAYYARMGWHSGPHFAATPEHWSYVLCDLNQDGVHASCFNRVSYGVEMAGDFRTGGDLFDTDVRDSAVNILASLHVRFGWEPGDYRYGVKGLHFHCECKADAHSCPGNLVSKPDIIARVRSRMAEITAQPRNVTPIPLASTNLPHEETPMPPTIEITPWPAESDDPQFFNDAALIFNCWKKYGVSDAFAYGMLANAEAESSLNIMAQGDHKSAYGIYQNHAERCTVIAQGTGIDLRSFPPIPKQVEAAWWELKTVEQFARLKIEAAKIASDAAIAACVYFERAGAPMAALRRGAMASRWQDYFERNKQILVANPAP